MGYVVWQRRKKLKPEFQGLDGEKIRDRYFELELEIRGRLPYLIFKRHPDAGEMTKLLGDASSRYQQRIRRIYPKAFYLQYLVWPDSFETYLEARKVAAKRGLLAGWIARTTTAEYKIPLGGKLRVGPPPPPPKPRPKPKPGEKPPPPRPKPRPVPKDTID